MLAIKGGGNVRRGKCPGEDVKGEMSYICAKKMSSLQSQQLDHTHRGYCSAECRHSSPSCELAMFADVLS